MLAALTYGLVLFLVVAVVLGTRSWVMEQIASMEAEATSISSAIPAPSAPPAKGAGEEDNVIAIPDWQAERDRRQHRKQQAQAASL